SAPRPRDFLAGAQNRAHAADRDGQERRAGLRRDEEAAGLERTEAGRAMKGTFRENDEALAGSHGVGGGRGILDTLFGVGALGEEGAKASEEDGRNNLAVELLLGQENKTRREYRDQDE